MSKQATISTEAQVLLKLLRLALGTEPRRYFGEPVEPFPTNINWKEVIRLSYQHKVSALAVDGLKSSGYDIYNGLNEQQTKELKPIADHWFKDITKSEQSYTYYLQVLNTLCQIFIANGLTPIILKGYGLSINYRKPSLRGAGDIDIYLIDSKGKCASEIGISIIRKLFNPKIELKSHHYEFTFREIVVELHNQVTNSISKSPEEESFIADLRDLIVADRIMIADGIYIPSATANAVLLIRHMFTHFFWRMNLRQLTDFYCFISKYSVDIDWNEVCSILHHVKHIPLFETINDFEVKYLNMNSNHLPYLSYNELLLNTLLYSLFVSQWHESKGLARIAFYYDNRHKVYLLSGEHWLKPTLRNIKRHLLHNTQNPIFKHRLD